MCGFLSKENRCRIHEELGGERKPLTCRLFPLRFHPAEGAPILSASFCCPTVVSNEGSLLGSQLSEVTRLQKEWGEAFPEPPIPRVFLIGRPMPTDALRAIREILREMLDRPARGGIPDLRSNVARMAQTLEDLSRYRVLRLPPPAFSEYLELTGRHAAQSERPLPHRPPSRLGRILFRGFLYTVVATRFQLEDGRTSGLRLGLRFRLLRLLAHFHGLGPGLVGADLTAARRAVVRLDDPAIHGLVYHYLRGSLATLGGGRRGVLEEVCLSVAFLNAAMVIARIRAAEGGKDVATAEDLAQGLMEAVDLGHAEGGRMLGAILGTLCGGVEALYLFAAGDSSGDRQGGGVAADV